MQNVEKADVMASGRLVGCLALTNRGLTAFEYSPQWIESGFSISPFSMPLKPGLYTSTNGSFEYIAGVFDDCLPDGWGRLLTDRYLASIGIDYTQASVITRLCMLGDTSSGLLEFVPRLEENKEEDRIDLDASFSASRLVLADKDISQSTMDDLFRHGGSSGGARPKVNVRIDGDLWIVKFPTSMDGDDAGVMEYECNKRAVDAGLETVTIQYRRHISHQSRSGKRKENPHDQPQWPSRIIPQVPRPGLPASPKGDIPPDKRRDTGIRSIPEGGLQREDRQSG